MTNPAAALVLASWGGLHAAPAEPHADPPPPRVAPAAAIAGAEAATRPPGVETVDQLLDALEAMNADDETLQSIVKYDKFIDWAGDREIRTGRLYYRSEPSDGGRPPNRAFAVNFNTLLVAGVSRPDVKRFVFDGRWLVEIIESERLITKYEVAPPGASFDPMRLGEGRFSIPLPVGQRKADITSRFEASMPPADDGLDNDDYIDFVNAGPGSHQLLLIPRDGQPIAEQFGEIRLWYQKGTLIPRLVRAEEHDGDVLHIQLGAVQRNEPLPDEALRVEPPEGWEVQVVEKRFDEAELREHGLAADPPVATPGAEMRIRVRPPAPGGADQPDTGKDAR